MAAGRGPAPTGGAGGDSAAAALGAEDGGFVTALDGHASPPDSDAGTGAQDPNDAAGPLTGELPTEIVADADISPDATQAAAAASIALAIAAVVPVETPSGAPPVAAPAGSLQAAPPQPLPGLVPARVDANGTVVPVLPGLTPAATAAPATAAAPAVSGDSPANPVVAAPPSATGTGTAPAPATPAPAATITLTLTSKDAPAAPGGTPASPAAGTAAAPAAVPAALPAPAGTATGAPASPTTTTGVVPQAGSGQDAPPAAAPREPAPAAAAPATSAAPAPGVALGQAAPAPLHTTAPGGTAHGAHGLTTAHELAHELGTRVHMAVREGGRELLVNLRPPDLGQLTIRVTMTDGVLHAQIMADRPEAARMLQQSLSQLDTALTDLGYSLDGLDVSYGGQDARDARSSTPGTDALGRTEADARQRDGRPRGRLGNHGLDLVVAARPARVRRDTWLRPLRSPETSWPRRRSRRRHPRRPPTSSRRRASSSCSPPRSPRQNPLEPMKDTEFVAQMASFSQLEQTTNMAANIKALTMSGQLSQGAALIGKSVTYQPADGTAAVTGVVQSLAVGAGRSMSLVVDGVSVDISQVSGITA